MKKLKVKTDGTPANTKILIDGLNEEIENVERVELYVPKVGQQETIMVVHIRAPLVEPNNEQ